MDNTIQRFLEKVEEIYVSNPPRREGGDGRNGCDCIGLIIGAIRRMGLKWTGIHGSNWAARKEFVKLYKISSADDLQVGDVVLKGRPPSNSKWCLPGRYRQGGAYYNGDLTDYYHAGVVVSVNPLKIKHMASKMTTDTKLNHNKNSVWNYHGVLKLLSDGGEVHPDPTPAEGKIAVVVAQSGSTVNLRKTPSLRGALITRVPLGTRVTIISPGEEWCHVSYLNKTGYMMAKFLDVVGDGKGDY
jgi:hypothetical protein